MKFVSVIFSLYLLYVDLVVRFLLLNVIHLDIVERVLYNMLHPVELICCHVVSSATV